jgi:UV DNA damage endonuclease
MIKRTFLKKGLEYASELAYKNVKDLITLIEWNNRHEIKVFRMTSCMFPWASEYNLEELPDYENIVKCLKIAGEKAKNYGQRLSFHPGPFNILSSPKPNVVENAYKDL